MLVAERFMSVQGEGTSVGCPAYFIRLQGCNLRCGGVGGSLMKEGKATWYCDTEDYWQHGVETSNEELVNIWKLEGIYDNILNGRIHLVWTGGEPALKRNATDILNFINFIDLKENFIYNELETNGTIITDYNDDSFCFYDYFEQINCSPKLANSGIEKEKRIVPAALEQIVNCNHNNYWFKFVINSEKDVQEIERDFIEPFDLIDPLRVILMPDVDKQSEVREKTRRLFEICKKTGYRGITRQQILVWDKKPGV